MNWKMAIEDSKLLGFYLAVDYKILSEELYDINDDYLMLSYWMVRRFIKYIDALCIKLSLNQNYFFWGQAVKVFRVWDNYLSFGISIKV